MSEFSGPTMADSRVVCYRMLVDLVFVGEYWSMPALSPVARLRSLAIAMVMTIVPVTGALAMVPTDSYVGGLGWVGLSKADLDRMNAAAARLIDQPYFGATVRWDSPDTGKSGEIRLLNSFGFRGMPCRTLDYTVSPSDPTDNHAHYVMSWCWVPEGVWKVVEIPTPR